MSSNDSSIDPEASTAEVFSTDELRLRKVLLSVQDCLNHEDSLKVSTRETVRTKVQSFADETVSWMSAEDRFISDGTVPMDEVIRVLNAHPGLNSSQLEILKTAMTRTITLLQVPRPYSSVTIINGACLSPSTVIFR
jgi:hypothetical protein